MRRRRGGKIFVLGQTLSCSCVCVRSTNKTVKALERFFFLPFVTSFAFVIIFLFFYAVQMLYKHMFAIVVVAVTCFVCLLYLAALFHNASSNERVQRATKRVSAFEFSQSPHCRTLQRTRSLHSMPGSYTHSNAVEMRNHKSKKKKLTAAHTLLAHIYTCSLSQLFVQTVLFPQFCAIGIAQ